jgi:hypothetical protein
MTTQGGKGSNATITPPQSETGSVTTGFTRSILIRCRRCGHQHAVSGDAVVAGLLARSCPRCFPPRADDDLEVA